MNKCAKNYAQWKVETYNWISVEEFTSATTIEDGIHTIIVPSGVEVDLFIRGNPFNTENRSILTFFGGAITGRSTKSGPFFSGLGIAGQLGIPIIAIADPGVEEDNKINIAWYTGGAGQKLQDSITAILNSLSARVGGELLFVGGSGGGFAALYYASRLRFSCSVFVWNAQTDVFKYLEKFVRPYLNGLFKYSMGSMSELDWIDKTRKRAAFHADLSILENNYASSPRRLFYLQNATDWHAQEHLKPFLMFNEYRPMENGMYQTDEDHICLVTHAAPGHLPPPVDMLKTIISMMENPETSSLQVAQKVQMIVPVVCNSSNNLPALI